MALNSTAASDNLPPLRKFIARFGPFLAAGTLLLAFVFLYLNTRNPQRPKAYYTEDDGKSWFITDVAIPPIMHNGHECPRVIMYSCDGGKTLFPGYLMRYTPEAKPKVEEELKRGSPLTQEGMEVKRVGDSEWAGAFDPRKLNASNAKQMIFGGGRKKFDEIIHPKCPDGKPVAEHNPT